ncbi:uncharacterized protein PV07_03366 [Cladophialophora immunda]|uniref:DUF7580 domain-containing protein n=1 Tax=Cladophialophora immunda TaxID=569365 RepID=A0A0D2CP12_9EURO|nr:uncharacterized protein PV07_03366 [Cladophialophora immunda]KIW31770.1 hypothetical protein PV07_03366 [Cladophialophora immunda]OQV01410.1 hypothetical protein CLAIMM_06777 [Cladophialophora immunda]
MAEAIGLALAIAPLIISAAEHYSAAARCIKRYCRYKEGQEELVSVVGIQRTIYRKTVERLLAYDIGFGDELASEMLKNADHPRWQDEEIDTYFAERMADSSEALKTSIRLLDAQLKVLNFDQAENGSRPGFGEKLHFALSNAQIQETITNIRRYTKDFRTLIEQTTLPRARDAVSKPSWATRNRVAKLAAVKDAADSLYEALGQACTKHTTHHAHLSLGPAHGDSSHVRFTIAFRRTTLQSASCDSQSSELNHPTWLTIESLVTGTIHSAETGNLLAEVASRHKRPRQSSSPSEAVRKPKKLVKSVKFHPSTGPTAPPTMIATPPSPPESEILNFCAHSNLCNRLKRLVGQPLRSPQPCVGYLECSGKSKHLVYINSEVQTITASKGLALKPLRDVYTALRDVNRLGTGIPRHERITLAKQLALAVLQFHATPWLTNSIASEDVFLLGVDEHSLHMQTLANAPYVSVSIKGPHGPLAKRTTFPGRTLIRNRILFSLGIMLLELVYQAPLKALQKPADVDAHEAQNTDYYTADRARHDAASMLGPRYAEVVRKCIQCDFGHGSDLGKTKLQEAFHQDIICELEELEERFRKFAVTI